MGVNMAHDTFIGVDPGKSGAIVAIRPNSTPIRTLADPLSLSIKTCLTNAFGLIEKVHAMPKQGVTSMFTFGENYGMMQMWLRASLGRERYDYITPQAWQKYFNLIKKKGETKTQKKNRHKALAQKLFPDIKVTHTNADALLIAWYCREIHG